MSMMGPLRPNAGEHNKAMFKEYRKRVLDALCLCDQPDMEISLPGISDIPFVSAGMRRDHYIKRSCSAFDNFKKMGMPLGPQDHWVSFIQKKEYYLGVYKRIKFGSFTWPFRFSGFDWTINFKGFTWPWPTNCGFTWRTTGKNLREGLRWGVIPAESITGKVINELGHYRIAAYERIIKGIISNSHRFKMALVDHYQDRFETLQELESLVNKNNSVSDYKKALHAYILKLKKIQKNISKDIDSKKADVLISGINKDLIRAQQYYQAILKIEKEGKPNDLKAFNQARGPQSIREFVKRQMIYGLSEMKGVNQYHTSQIADGGFKLTTGILGDCIENAFNAIRNDRADVSNIITPAHHGHLGQDDEIVVYNFKHLHFSPEREKEILLGISFIEKWDDVRYQENKPYLYSTNQGVTQYRPLEEVAATFWRVSLNLDTFLKKVGMMLWSAVQSALVRTQSWDENPWSRKDERGEYLFRPYAARLRRSSYTKTYENKDPWYTRLKKLIFGGDSNYTGARPNYPLWVKALRFLLKLGTGIADIGFGLREVGKDLFFHMPKSIYYDWKAATRKLLENTGDRLKFLADLKQKTQQQIADIEHDFKLFMMGYKIKWIPERGEQPEEDTLYVERKSDYVLAYKVWSQDGWLEGEVTLPEAMVKELNDYYSYDKVTKQKYVVSVDKSTSIYYRMCGKYHTDATDFEIHYLLDHLPAVIKAAAKNGHTQPQVGLNKLFQAALPRPKSFIANEQNATLRLNFTPCPLDLAEQFTTHAKFAEASFHLEQGYPGGPVGLAFEGLDGFIRIFSENFAKTPFGAAVYGTGYVLTGGSVCLPNVFAFLGPAFASWAQALGSSIASGGVSSAIASAALAGQFGLAVVDVIERGPSSGAIKAIHFMLDDPLSIGLGLSAAWLAGHVLTLTIPSLEHDLGTNKDIGKLTLGGKSMVLLSEAIEKAHQNPGNKIEFMVDNQKLELSVKKLSEEQQAVKETLKKQLQKEQIQVADWLNKHKHRLSMLDDDAKHDWIYYLEQTFGEKIAASLKKYFYPEAADRFIVQVLRMPLSYIPAIIRVAASFVSSILTKSTLPMQIAWQALRHKMLKDLAQLLTVAEIIVRLMGRISVVPEVLTSVIIGPVGRIFALAGIDVFSAWYQFSAECSVMWRKVGEYLYGTFANAAIKSVSVEHPTSVVLREKSTYFNVIGKMLETPTHQPSTSSLIIESDNEIEIVDKEKAPINTTSSSPVPNSFLSPRQ